jgi:hypothetical protein
MELANLTKAQASELLASVDPITFKRMRSFVESGSTVNLSELQVLDIREYRSFQKEVTTELRRILGDPKARLIREDETPRYNEEGVALSGRLSMSPESQQAFRAVLKMTRTPIRSPPAVPEQTVPKNTTLNVSHGVQTLIVAVVLAAGIWAMFSFFPLKNPTPSGDFVPAPASSSTHSSVPYSTSSVPPSGIAHPERWKDQGYRPNEADIDQAAKMRSGLMPESEMRAGLCVVYGTCR